MTDAPGVGTTKTVEVLERRGVHQGAPSSPIVFTWVMEHYVFGKHGKQRQSDSIGEGTLVNNLCRFAWACGNVLVAEAVGELCASVAFDSKGRRALT